MTIRNRITELGLEDVRTAIVAAEAARTFTDRHRDELNASVQDKAQEYIRANRRFESAGVREHEADKLNAKMLVAYGDTAKAAHQRVIALRPALETLTREARRPAPLPPVISEAERKSFLPSEIAHVATIEAVRTMAREVRMTFRPLLYASWPVADQLELLEEAQRSGDLELLHTLEPLVERQLRTAPAAIPGDLEAFTAATEAHKALVTRLEQLRHGRLTEDDRAALAEAESQVRAVEKAWSSEAAVHDAVQHVRRIVPEREAATV
jgi:hypothetical protein